LSLRKFVVPVVAAVAALLLTAPAGAAPSLKDARHANVKAKRAVAASVIAARSSTGDAAAKVARARRLQARAARLSRRAGAHRSAAAKARLLRGAAAGVDGAFDSYAELLPEVPPELQPVIEITGFIDDLPPDVRDRVLAAIAAFQSDGDLEALLQALTDPAVTAGVQAQLQELITNLTGMLQEQIGSFEGLEELLPPGALEQLQEVATQLQSQLESVLGMLGEIFGDPGQVPELPGDPTALCGQLEALLEQLGLPVPPGFCDAA
jgi:hypothetical protein